MDEGTIRQLRRVKMYVRSGREAIREIRLKWNEREKLRKEFWRLTQIVDIALDDAEDKMSWLIHSAEEQPERSVEPADVASPSARLGGLRVALSDGRGKPVIAFELRCDSCGHVIEGSGTILFDVNQAREAFFFHKGCCRSFADQNAGRWSWLPLDSLPVHLARGFGMHVRKSQSGSGWIIDPKRSLPVNELASVDQDRETPGAPPVAPNPVSLDPRRTFSAMQKQEILLRSNGHCVSCGQELCLDWHADHIYPHSLGGVTEVINGQALCQPCNSRKRAKVLTVDVDSG